MTDTIIQLEQVVLEREHFRLGPLQLEIPKGYISAIVGPNGSGKSSTFQLLLRQIMPDSGTITLLGERVDDERGELTAKKKIGYLPEEASSQENWMRGKDKADFVRYWYPSWNVNRYNELLRLFEVNDNMKLGKLSKGLRRKLDLAITLAHSPELLLLDEPSSGLDPISWKKMLHVLQQYMEEDNRTIVMATHIMDEVKRLADYIIFMANGRLLGVYEKDELLGNWHAFFLKEQDASELRLRQLPGMERLEAVGGGFLRVISSEARAAEQWLIAEGWSINGQQPLEMDDILEVLMAISR